MEEGSGENVEVEIQQTLDLINKTTLKIVRELKSINEIVRERGSLNAAVDNANAILSKVIRDRRIETNFTDEKGSEDELENLMIPVTVDCLTEKLMAIIHKGKDSS